MPSMRSSSAPGIAAAVARPPETCTILSAEAVHDQRRHRQRAQLRRAVRLGEDRHHLAQRAAGGDAAVVGLGGARAGLLLAGRVARGADEPPGPDARSRCRPRGPARRPSRFGSRLGCCQPTVRLPVVDMMLVSDRTRFGCGDRHRLRDHAAHRDAADVRGLQPEVVEQAEGVVGHVGQGVRRPHPTAGERPGPAWPESPGRAPAGAAGVAVVEADRRGNRGRPAAGTARGPTRSSARPAP